MYRPILIAAFAALSACEQRTADEQIVAAVEEAQNRAAADDGAIPCAHAGQAALRRDCLVERSDSPAGLVLTLRHADGAFRRLLVTKDGRGVIAADGAEPARVTVQGADRIAVEVGGDRYELPATVKGGGPAK